MRRLSTRPEGSLFRRGEWFRFVSMIMTLVILTMMFLRARDASMWRWLVNDHSPSSAADVAQVPAPSDGDVELFDGPTDEDPDEADAARELFAAISDKAALAPEEMPAYWRLWRWTRAQPLESLRNRARRDLTLSHFLEEPDKLRGQLVRLRLHLRRSLSWEIGPEEKSGGAKVVYEAWGWSDESPNFYCTVFTQPPAGMPIGPTVQDEVTFYGYFLKLLSYRDQQDKLRMAPLLIGRVERHVGVAVKTDESPWAWATLAVGGAFILLLVIRWTRAYAFPKPPVERLSPDEGRASVVKWSDSSNVDEPDEIDPANKVPIDLDIRPRKTIR